MANKRGHFHPAGLVLNRPYALTARTGRVMRQHNGTHSGLSALGSREVDHANNLWNDSRMPPDGSCRLYSRFHGDIDGLEGNSN